jgi:DNA helicase-2/ATP-dependent DNA helicase PcrA
MRVEAAPMLEDLNNVAAFGDKRMRNRRIWAFEAAWARLQSEDPGWPHDQVDRQFQAALVAWLKFHNGMLVGKLIPETLRYLRNNPLAEELHSFDHVIVDEYQDLNKAEQVLIDLLAKHGTTAIVGDEDQSIYSFRHANPEGIVEFGDTRPHTHDETLNECRRCPRRVVALADHLIQHNHLAADTVPRLSPCPGSPDGEVHIVQWATLQEEAQGLAAYATHLVSDRGYSLGDILILCPRRLIGYGIRDALQNAGLPTHSFYHEEALESDEAQEAFALLTLLTDREDRVALRFWLGFGSPTWLQGEYRTMRKHCEESGQSPWQALMALQTGMLRLARTGHLLKRFGFLLERLDTLEPLRGYNLLEQLFPASQPWAETLHEAAALELTEDTDAKALFSKLRTFVTQPEMPESGEFARVMSLHKSKGLTSRVVIVSGCIHGLIPFVDRDGSPVQQDETLKNSAGSFTSLLPAPKKFLSYHHPALSIASWPTESVLTPRQMARRSRVRFCKS